MTSTIFKPKESSVSAWLTVTLHAGQVREIRLDHPDQLQVDEFWS